MSPKAGYRGKGFVPSASRRLVPSSSLGVTATVPENEPITPPSARWIKGAAAPPPATLGASRLPRNLGHRNRSWSPIEKSRSGQDDGSSGNAIGSRSQGSVNSARRSVETGQGPPPRSDRSSPASSPAPAAHERVLRKSSTTEGRAAAPVSSVVSEACADTWYGPGRSAAREAPHVSDHATREHTLETSSVTVVARVRPRLPGEAARSEGVTSLADGRTIVIVDDDSLRKRQFAVDDVVDSRDSEGSQSSFFQQVGAGLVQQTLSGYNICVMAYGHTGSGKTYTMLGSGKTFRPEISGDGAGLLPRFLQEQVNLTGCSEDVHYTCEFIEIYNDRIRDLLAPPSEVGEDRTRTVHVHPRHGVKIDGLQPSVVTSIGEVMELIHYGNQMRMVSTTTMNQRSSRSHAIFTFNLESRDTSRQVGSSSTRSNRKSSMTFVDLAGREDQTVSINRALQFKEMVFINTSLFHLANVITKLANGAIKQGSLSEFRNSKLTLLLSPALIGNSRTTLIATLSPLAELFDDTCSTLAFAQTVKKIKTRPVVNHGNVTSELEEEIKSLRKELAEVKSDSWEKGQQLRTAEALASHYRSSWEEERQHSAELQKQREIAVKHLGLSWQQSSPMVPFLTNLSSDPSLQGVCNYFLEDPVIYVGSDARNCSMLLHGVGIASTMCEIRRTASGGVTIQLCCTYDELPRVLVNGVALMPRHVRELYDKDCLIFGYSHSFRVLIPTELHSGDRDGVDLDIASAIEEVCDTEGPQFKAAAPFLLNLKPRVNQSVLQAFVQALHRICPLVDEANLITREMRPRDGLRFELNVLTDLFDFQNDKPELVVCVIWNPQVLDAQRSRVASVVRQFRMRPRAMSLESSECSSEMAAMSSMSRTRARTASNVAAYPWTPLVNELGLEDQMSIGEEGELLLYVWALEKFLGRLRDIRELYDEGLAANTGDYRGFEQVCQRLHGNPDFDPWHEASFAGVQLLLDGFTGAGESVPVSMAPANREFPPRKESPIRSSYPSVIKSAISAAADRRSLSGDTLTTDAESCVSNVEDAYMSLRLPVDRQFTVAGHEFAAGTGETTSGCEPHTPAGNSQACGASSQPGGSSLQSGADDPSSPNNRSKEAIGAASELISHVEQALGAAKGLMSGLSKPTVPEEPHVSQSLTEMPSTHILAELTTQRLEVARVTAQRDRLAMYLADLLELVDSDEPIKRRHLAELVEQIRPALPETLRRCDSGLGSTGAVTSPTNTSCTSPNRTPTHAMQAPQVVKRTTEVFPLTRKSLGSASEPSFRPQEPRRSPTATAPASPSRSTATIASTGSAPRSSRVPRSVSPSIRAVASVAWPGDCVPPAVGTAMICHQKWGMSSRSTWPARPPPKCNSPPMVVRSRVSLPVSRPAGEV